MTDSPTPARRQELVPADQRLAELEKLEMGIRGDLLGAAAKLAEIKRRELWKAAGYLSWTAYVVGRLRLDKGTASRLVSAFPVLERLSLKISNTDAAAVRPSHVLAVEGMPVERAVGVLVRAIEHAPVDDRTGRPRLTRKLVEDEARKGGWKPKREYIAEQRAAEGAPAPKPRRKHDYDRLRRACETILALPTAGELSSRYQWTDADRELFSRARTFLGDVLE
jgi:hypothetical protein